MDDERAALRALVDGIDWRADTGDTAFAIEGAITSLMDKRRRSLQQTAAEQAKQALASATRCNASPQAQGYAPPALPINETARQRSLDAMRLSRTSAPALDAVVEVAAAAFDVPIALVSLVDRDQQWFKAKVGLEASSTRRHISFCGHAILGDDVFVVADATADPRFAGNPLVVGPPHIRFYAGAPLIVAGYKLGTLCLIDTKPRTGFTTEDAMRLRGFAARAATLLERNGLEPA